MNCVSNSGVLKWEMVRMNSAYKRMIKRQQRQQRIAELLGWVVIGLGVMVCHGIWYGWLLYRASVL